MCGLFFNFFHLFMSSQNWPFGGTVSDNIQTSWLNFSAQNQGKGTK